MIKGLEFQITNKCNIGCYYCINNPAANTAHEVLKFDYVVKCINDIKPMTVLFTGGEPTLEWERLIECIKYAKSKNITVILGSNLTTLSKEQIDYLIDECKIDYIHTSFNDLTPEMSFKVRKMDESKRDKLIKNIEYIAKERNFPIKVESLLLKETLNQYSEINKFLYNIGVKYHRIELLLPLGHAKWNDVPEITDVVNAILKTYREKAENSKLELSCCYFTPCTEEFKEIFSINDETFIKSKCEDGQKVFYIMANGLFTPCYAYYCDDLPSIKDNSLSDLIYNSELVNHIKHDENIKCKKCEYYRADGNISCNNGCWALNLIESNSIKNMCNEYVKEKLTA